MFHIRRSFFLIIVLFCTYLSATAQKNVSRAISWELKNVALADNISTKQIETFDQAIFDFRYKDLSIYTEKFNQAYASVEIVNAVYKPLSIQLKDEQIKLIQESPIVEYGPVYEKKKEFFAFSILPYRYNKSQNKVEVLESFQLKFTEKSNKSNVLNSSRTYASESVLKSGNWFKLGISTTGLHKLSYSDLEALGINPANIDPRNIRIYGNGHGMLPEHNAVFRYDDLQENAIIVTGENDGQFNQGDWVVFFARGPINWTPNFNDSVFIHEQHPYSTESFYFITTDLGIGKRVTDVSGASLSPNKFISDYNIYLLHETNRSTGVNTTIKSGRERYGEEFGTQSEYDFNFNLTDVITNKPMKLRVDAIGRAEYPASSDFIIKYNNSTVRQLFCPGVDFEYTSSYGSTVSTGYTRINPGVNPKITIEYRRQNFSSLGYLNFITINAVRKLKLINNEISFRSFESVGLNNITQFSLETDDASNTIIWDVTDRIDPKRVVTTTNGNNLLFNAETNTLKEYCAFKINQIKSPRLVGRIENQNLHGLGFYDFIILTHPDFISQAERLAEYRRTNSNLKTLVITADKIYNEFSSGAADASAVRDFLKMFYDRAGSDQSKMPKYLLMFGDGSYDNIGVLNTNTNYVITYESRNSFSPIGSYVSDDYFGLLDDVEGNWEASNPTYGSVAIDVAVGRLPIQSAMQASQMVDKIIKYSNTASFGDWRNKYVLIADDEDGNLHLNHAENHYKTILSRTKNINIDKIYMDSYEQISTPAGNRYPEVNSAFNQRANTGALVINYIGHGGENGLGHEKILTFDDIKTWKGFNNMPVLMTATCSFSRWDDPAFQSAGEASLLQANGGAIALFTTTRVVYAHENETVNRAFLISLFDSSNVGSNNTLGDIFIASKNYKGVGLSINQRNFTLLGDPSLPFATPKHQVITDSINSKAINSSSADTLKALRSVTIKGYIADNNGNPLNNVNGIIYPTVYDKKTIQRTLGQDNPRSRVQEYEVQKNIIYKGKASVSNGKFSFSFVVPKDISYTYGFGRLSYYAQLGAEDANGAFDSIYVGGSSDNVIADNVGPEMQIFLNNENYVNKGITGERPVLIVKMKDANGINTVGNGIGHNITATLTSNNKTEKIDLNEFYEATLDSYQEGEVKYTFGKLNPGNYKLSVKAWDVVNNSSEISTDFTVVESGNFSIDKVFNYPNPFTTSTGFQFEHNRPSDDLQVMIQIFTVSGKLVKTITKDINASGSRVSDIMWDARDEFGDKLARGVYVYRMKVKASDGSISDKYEKLVILK